MRMPVFSEAMAAAFETAQFWKGGKYSRSDKTINKAASVTIAMPIHLNAFFSLGFMVVVLLLLFAIGVGQFICFANLRIFSEYMVKRLGYLL